jgi:hypothetical protein
MANVITEHKIIDENKRALIKYSFLSDGSQVSNTILMDASSLVNAMNANNMLMVSNTHQKSLYRTTIKRIWGHAKANGHFNLQWHGDANNSIIRFSSGSFDYNFDAYSSGGVIPNPEANSNGDILISTGGGMLANDYFTILVDLKKDAKDFQAGQLTDPVAFNR